VPQRDNRISRRFGKLPVGLWESLGEKPGRQCESALADYLQARRKGRKLPPLPAGPTGHFGKARTIWLLPDVKRDLDEAADIMGVSYTAILLAALAFVHGPEILKPPPSSEPPKRKGRPRRDIQSAPAELTV
jgi:hypothetical protein